MQEQCVIDKPLFQAFMLHGETTEKRCFHTSSAPATGRLQSSGGGRYNCAILSRQAANATTAHVKTMFGKNSTHVHGTRTCPAAAFRCVAPPPPPLRSSAGSKRKTQTVSARTVNGKYRFIRTNCRCVSVEYPSITSVYQEFPLSSSWRKFTKIKHFERFES